MTSQRIIAAVQCRCLNAVQNMYAGKKGFLSFEQRMGCGIGACFACVCQTTEGDGKSIH